MAPTLRGRTKAGAGRTKEAAVIHPMTTIKAATTTRTQMQITNKTTSLRSTRTNSAPIETVVVEGSSKSPPVVPNDAVEVPTSTTNVEAAPKTVKAARKSRNRLIRNDVNDDIVNEPNKVEISHVFSLKTVSKLGDVKAGCYLGPVSNYAQYDKKQKHFTLSADLYAKKGFALEKTTFSSGPYAGYQALVLVPVPAHKFPFLELPPELRNVVYEALLAPKGRQITTTGNSSRSFEAYSGPTDFRTGSGLSGKRARTSLSPITAIFSVCHEVREEALSVFYGCNRFRAATVASLEWFLEQIGSAKKYVRYISVDMSYVRSQGRTGRQLYSSAVLLAEAKNLTRLEMDIREGHVYHYYGYNNGIAITRIVTYFKLLLKTLVERGEDEASILDIITFIDVDRCGAHRSLKKDDAVVERCVVCRGRQENLDDNLNLFKDAIISCLKMLKREEEKRLKAEENRLVREQEKAKKTSKAKRKARREAKPAVRRDTGRAKRKSAANVTYIEVDEDEDALTDEEDEKDDAVAGTVKTETANSESDAHESDLEVV